MSVKHRLRHIPDSFDHRDFPRTAPRLTIVADGIDDVYRLARVLERAQVEFAEIGHKTLVGLDRKYPGIIRIQLQRMGPQTGYQGRVRRARKHRV